MSLRLKLGKNISIFDDLYIKILEFQNNSDGNCIFRADAMIRIQDSLRGRKSGEAVALFRAAR